MHWTGHHSLLRSGLVNGLLGYLILVAVAMIGGQAVGTQPLLLSLTILLFAVFFVWVIVGTVRRALRQYRKNLSLKSKAIAILSVLICIAVSAYCIKDLLVFIKT